MVKQTRRSSQWLLILLLFLSACDDRAEPVTLSGDTMGTTWSVVLPSPPGDSLQSALQWAIEHELVRINDLMSTYQADSALSQFNRNQTTQAQWLDPEILWVIDAAIEVSHATDGIYDVTLGAVIDVWGFGPSGQSTAIPAKAELEAAASATGFKQLQRQGQVLSKAHPMLRVDLSSLAKGYAVDRIGVIVERAGINHYLAEIGGEIKSRGEGIGRQPWRIGIENPNGQATEGIAVGDVHLASSGSYRNYREHEGKRVSHLIDGQSHQPISHATVAATVLHRNTMLADAWATAAMVVSPEKAKELLEQRGIDAQLTFKTDDGFSVWRTPGFSALITE